MIAEELAPELGECDPTAESQLDCRGSRGHPAQKGPEPCGLIEDSDYNPFHKKGFEFRVKSSFNSLKFLLFVWSSLPHCHLNTTFITQITDPIQIIIIAIMATPVAYVSLSPSGRLLFRRIISGFFFFSSLLRNFLLILDCFICMEGKLKNQYIQY